MPEHAPEPASEPAPEPAVHVFAGPTIPSDRIRRLLPAAHVHPPVQHGDLLRLAPRPGDTVAVVDGTFFQSPSVRHKELLHLIDRGVTVHGASSMGALRAAELAPLGMRGAGVVYRLYALGVLERDDEVAVAHATGDDGFVALSDALVSIRFAARRARVAGALDRAAERLIVEAAAAMPFPQRRHATAARAARRLGLIAAHEDAYLEHAARTADIKRADAELLLRIIARESGPITAGVGRATSGADPADPPTVFLAEWLRSFRGELVDGEHVTDEAVLTCCKLFATDYADFHREHVLNALDPATLQRAGVPAGLRATPESAAALVRGFCWAPGVPPDDLMLELLRATPAWECAQGIVVRALRLNRELSRLGYPVSRVSSLRLHTYFTERWGTEQLDGAILDRGFASRYAFTTLAAPFLPLALLKTVEPFALRASGR
ncbi:TfuA-like protein [Streptomyces sp. NPDC020845]|uniref:TfuA-like protein n=1 Tax=Streptomyces sp. NPDC020845 TaxID=3365096 RepID=UPI00378E2D73